MGRRGTKPTPTQILEARGSWQAKHRKPYDPTPDDECPEEPGWFEEAVSAEYQKLVGGLARMGILGVVDENVLARYCAVWIRYVELEKALARDGLYILDDDGRKILNPAIDKINSLCDKLLRMEQQLGMTPSARAGIAIDRNKKATEPKLKKYAAG